MKKYNTRMLVTSGLLLGLTTVAMSTGTYAWFTVNKQAAFSATATVKADNDVEIGLAEFGGHPALDYGTSAINLDEVYGLDSTTAKANLAKAADQRTKSSHVLQDISGDGATFFKPVFGADNSTFNSVGTVTSYNNYYMVATFKFRSDNAYHIMLGDNTNIIEDTNTGTQLNLAARLAFFDSGKDFTTTLTRSMLRTVVYDGSANEYYITANTAASKVTNTAGTANTGYAKLSEMNITDATYCDQTNKSIAFADDNTSKPSSIEAGHSAGYRSLTVLAKSGNTYTSADGTQVDEYLGSVTVVLWIEGADEQCVTSNRDGKLSVSVDFAALIA